MWPVLKVPAGGPTAEPPAVTGGFGLELDCSCTASLETVLPGDLGDGDASFYWLLSKPEMAFGS